MEEKRLLPILGSYLIKRKIYDDAIIILQDWLGKCNSLKPLDKELIQYKE
jgi:hypothetical protein